jgi:hypothetical protein
MPSRHASVVVASANFPQPIRAPGHYRRGSTAPTARKAATTVKSPYKWQWAQEVDVRQP